MLSNIKKKDLFIYLGVLAFALIAPNVFSDYRIQFTFWLVLIILAITWNIQGGEMGYNTFGNIMFFGVGMYVCSGIQIGLFFDLAEWTVSGGEKTFIHTPDQYFQGLWIGLLAAAIIPATVSYTHLTLPTIYSV